MGNPAGLADYEYDYSDYNETAHPQASSSAIANAASSLHAQILDNVRHNIEQDKLIEAKRENAVVASANSNTNEKVAMVMDPTLAEAASAVMPVYVEPMAAAAAAAAVDGSADAAAKSRPKRSSDTMLSRRKGQLSAGLVQEMFAVPKSEAFESPDFNAIVFSCEDKMSGAAYADIPASCSGYYICMEVAKGKLVPYRLTCANGRRFNQLLGQCDRDVTDKACGHSERYFHYNKWYRLNKKHNLQAMNKEQEQ